MMTTEMGDRDIPSTTQSTEQPERQPIEQPQRQSSVKQQRHQMKQRAKQETQRMETIAYDNDDGMENRLVQGYVTLLGFEVRSFRDPYGGYMLVRPDVEKALGYIPNGFRTTYKSTRPRHSRIRTSCLSLKGLEEGLHVHEYEEVLEACKGFHVQKNPESKVDTEGVKRMRDMRMEMRRTRRKRVAEDEPEDEKGREENEETETTAEGKDRKEEEEDQERDGVYTKKEGGHGKGDKKKSGKENKRRTETTRQLRERLAECERKNEWLIRRNRCLKKRKRELESSERALKERIVEMDRYKDRAFDELMKRFGASRKRVRTN